MAEAVGAIKRLSEDPEVARAAQEREDAAAWYRISLAKAEREGKAEGKAELLISLFAQRFGPLSDEHRARFESATAADWDRWSGRLFSAESLADLLKD